MWRRLRIQPIADRSFAAEADTLNTMEAEEESYLLKDSINTRKQLQIPSQSQYFNESGYKYLHIWKRVLFRIKIRKALQTLNDDLLIFGSQDNYEDLAQQIDNFIPKQSSKKLTENYEHLAIIKVNRPWYILPPGGPFKSFWNIIVSILLIYTASLMPYRLAFAEVQYFDSWAIFELIVDALFTVDMILNFISSYNQRDGTPVYDIKKIAVGYMKTWFILDFIACFPFGLIEFYFLDDQDEERSQSGRYNNFARLLRLPRLYKLLRIARLAKMFKHLKQCEELEKIRTFLKMNARMYKLGKFALTVGCCVHITGCIWYFCAKLEYFDPSGWVADGGYIDSTDSTKYIAAIYWSFQTVTTVGYGDISAGTDLEMVLAITWMVLGVGFYSFTIGSLSSFLSQLDSRETELNSKLAALQEFAEETGISLEVKVKIREKLKYNSAKLSGYKTDKKSLFNEIPKALRFEVAMSMYDGIAKDLILFNHRDEAFVVAIMPLLNPLHVFDQEFLYNEKDHADEFYIITKGRVHLVVEGSSIFYNCFMKGSYIGEVELFIGCPRIDNAQVIGTGEFLCLSKTNFQWIISEFPEDARHLRSKAKLRMQVNKQRKNQMLDYLDSKPQYREVAVKARKFNLFGKELNEYELKDEEEDLKKVQHVIEMTEGMVDCLQQKLDSLENAFSLFAEMIDPLARAAVDGLEGNHQIRSLLSL